MSDEYTDYYLKFADQAEIETVYRAPTMDDDGITYPGCFVYGQGLIVDTPAVLDEDGNEITPPVFADGWHINVATKGELPDALKPYQIDAPATPVWVRA